MADDFELNIFAFLYLEPTVGDWLESEAQDTYHWGEFQVLSYSYGVSNPDAGKAGTGKDKSQSEPQNAVLKVVYSVASPQLFMMACRGDKIARATLSVRKLGARSKADADYQQIMFCDAYILDYKVNAGDTSRQTEEFTLKYQSLDVGYRQQDEHGKLASPTKRAYSWNLHKSIDSLLPYYIP